MFECFSQKEAVFLRPWPNTSSDFRGDLGDRVEAAGFRSKQGIFRGDLGDRVEAAGLDPSRGSNATKCQAASTTPSRTLAPHSQITWTDWAAEAENNRERSGAEGASLEAISGDHYMARK